MNVVVLYGTGGIGKTQLALEYAHQSQDAGRYTSIFWIDGTRNDTAAASIEASVRELRAHYVINGLHESPRYRLIEEALNSTSTSEREQLARENLLKWLSYPDNRSWLMIIDNVDDPEAFDIRTLLPPKSGGSILITSRRSDLAMNWKPIEVLGMEDSEALSLLEQSGKVTLEAGSTGKLYRHVFPGPSNSFPSEAQSAQALVEALGHLPLALTQAGAHIAMSRNVRPVTEYLNLFLRYPQELLARKTVERPWDQKRDNVLATWEISFAAVAQKMPEAASILLMCGFLSPASIDKNLFIGSELGLQSGECLSENLP